MNVSARRPIPGPGHRRPTAALAAATAASLVWVATLAAQPAASPFPAAPPLADKLQLFDGSVLHGALDSIDPQRTVQWRHPAARNLLGFRADNLRQIRFHQATKPPAVQNATCRLVFDNGDEVIGNLIQLDAQSVELETWFGGRLKAPRAGLQEIHFLWRGYQATYEGPTGTAGWHISPGGDVWRYEDGAFYSQAVGSLGRDVQLPARARISFDLSWSGQLSLAFSVYTAAVDRFDFGASSYIFYLGPGYVTLQRVQSGVGTAHVGQAQVPSLQNRNRARFELRCDREQATLALLVDGELVQQWKDQGGFASQGTGLAFFSQRMGPSVRLSGLRVAEWDGRSETANPVTRPADANVVQLMNSDRADGRLEGVTAGRAELVTDFARLKVPVERIADIYLRPEGARPNVTPDEVRAVFAGGGSVTLKLERWSRGELAGRNRNFGLVTFKPEWVRLLQFNLHRDGQTEDEGAFLRKEDFWLDD